ncbi:MAG: acyclic terpene utilization AtuA family protein, partial [Pseudomonadota bacterium]
MTSKVHIGCGAGFAGDRFDACLPVLSALAKHDGPRYLIFEVLAERTLALAQQIRRGDPDRGYSPYLDHYLSNALGPAMASGVRIVSNMGAANPLGAARRAHVLAHDLGLRAPKIAVVTGDDLAEVMSESEIREAPTLEGTDFAGRSLIAANAYLGARPVAEALATAADIVLVGRTTDSALVLGPLIHEFGWEERDWDRLAAGTVAGHLLECGAQVTGAYFADPGKKDVPDLARVGFPIAEIASDGEMTITKPKGTGGCVTTATVTEQLLYE